MNQTTHLLTLALDCEVVVALVTRRLADDGLQVIRSFDLQTARAAHVNCTCPYHGTEQCDSQMHLTIVDSPQQRLIPELERDIVQALVSEQSLRSHQDLWAHAP